MDNQAVFLDRDGTINEDVGYLDNPERLKFLPRAVEAIKLLNNKVGIKVIVVSNQSGVARGFFSEETVKRIDEKMQEELLAQGASIDATYFCPHHPEIGKQPYRVNCECRKPNPGLLLQAAREYGIELRRSYMVGDKMSDIEAGVNARCRTILVLSGEGHQSLLSRHKWKVSPDHVALDLYEAVQWIIEAKLTQNGDGK